MIAALRFVLSAKFLSGFVIALALGVVVSGVVALRVYGSGYGAGAADTTRRYEAAAAIERDRQAQANSEAAERQRLQYARLMDLVRQKNDLIEDLRDVRESDPRAAEPAISGDSMRRINRF